MRISKVENKGIYTFTVEERGYRNAIVHYDPVALVVRCANCEYNSSCNHIYFIYQVMEVNPDWQTIDFIADWTGSRMITPDFDQMKRTFMYTVMNKRPSANEMRRRNKLIAEALRRISSSPPDKPKDLPSPFSLIELD